MIAVDGIVLGLVPLASTEAVAPPESFCVGLASCGCGSGEVFAVDG